MGKTHGRGSHVVALAAALACMPVAQRPCVFAFDPPPDIRDAAFVAKPGSRPPLAADVLSSKGVEALGDVSQAHVNRRTIRLPVIDGNDIRFTRLPNASGLSQTRVAHIVQDDSGFIWFGTQYGLDRYDGYNFKVFIHVETDPNSLSGVYIHSLFKDRSGMLWMGTDQFLD